MIEKDYAFLVEGNCVDYKNFPETHTIYNLWAITNLEYIHLEFMLLHLDQLVLCVHKKKQRVIIQGQDTTPSPTPSRRPTC